MRQWNKLTILLLIIVCWHYYCCWVVYLDAGRSSRWVHWVSDGLCEVRVQRGLRGGEDASERLGC